MARCSIRTLHSVESFCTAAGASKLAGRYNTGEALILGSIMLWQSVIDRVSVSHAEEIYCKMGLRPASCGDFAGPAACVGSTPHRQIVITVTDRMGENTNRRSNFKRC